MLVVSVMICVRTSGAWVTKFATTNKTQTPLMLRLFYLTCLQSIRTGQKNLDRLSWSGGECNIGLIMFGIDLFSKILILDAILVFQFYAFLHVIFALVVCILSWLIYLYIMVSYFRSSWSHRCHLTILLDELALCFCVPDVWPSRFSLSLFFFGKMDFSLLKAHNI